LSEPIIPRPEEQELRLKQNPKSGPDGPIEKVPAVLDGRVLEKLKPAISLLEVPQIR
jgi:hypothetical protein